MKSLFDLLYGPTAIINGQEARVGDFLCVSKTWKSEIIEIDDDYLVHRNPNVPNMTWKKNWTRSDCFSKGVYIEKAKNEKSL